MRKQIQLRDRFAPEYTSFASEIDTEALLHEGGRHIVQLGYCDLDDRDLIDHLKYMSYYGGIRQARLSWAHESQVREIEATTYANYRDVRYTLMRSGEDEPWRRLSDTKDKGNSATRNEQERWGSCIYLTRDGIDDQRQISWKE